MLQENKNPFYEMAKEAKRLSPRLPTTANIQKRSTIKTKQIKPFDPSVKNWIVISPGRTGSLTIVRSIYPLYNYDFDTIKYIGPNELPHSLLAQDIVHTHNLEWLNQVNDNTVVIVSTRNPVESALSFCILPKIGAYHFYPFKDEDIEKLKSFKVEKFHLDPDEFLSMYNQVVDFYQRLSLKDSYYVIDYSDWVDDPTTILNVIVPDTKTNARYLTIKNPGTYDTWIDNWEEISKICEKLPQNVNEMIGRSVII